MNKTPTLSIITVIYNDCAGLKETYASIQSQQFTDYEWIVIDGGSNDGSAAFLTQHDDQIAYWISEADNGIYDAMNKGLAHATGNWVTFMNAGDSYVSPEALNTVFSRSLDHVSFIYTDMFLLNASGKHVRKIPAERLTYNSITKGMIACHQGMLIRRDSCPTYDISFRYQGDLNWTMQILKQLKPEQVLYIPVTLVYFKSGGFSDHTIGQQLREHLYLIVSRYGYFMLLLRLPRLFRRYIGKWLRIFLGIETFRFWIKS